MRIVLIWWASILAIKILINIKVYHNSEFYMSKLRDLLSLKVIMLKLIK